ncbi:uncharacterized protein N7473_003467 [Penicillium subrubescens]|uniref:WHIM1 domain-containing protein n=1 Tax=Penicillium subrubescens TaxID=1316194 RepID=A0A1Q5TI32_9EURO|nr:uncharacterized protein N7473_003467 [Penicillium subrubescens]KAJ5906551.1 hypothetical protein N7473_003467 [Penicillium subrubescens]OKO99883.1 hypothetical protein PENSUB_8100 [Penicillium subrubescens]
MAHSDSDLSSLSSAPPTDDETAMAIDEPVGIAKYFKKESETPPPKREPSPPHEYVLADNPHIPFIVTFRARFHEAFPRSLPHFGPQDIEKGVEDSVPGEYIERLLCALLGLVLNRKKDVERNHFTRPLEEAIQVHQSQWPKAWEGKNPLHGGRTFATMSPEERLELLRALILWSLSSSDAIQAKIKESYKQSRHDDDLNQPLSVQPWGRDSLKRRYWLIEGQDDTHFRLYRESNPALKTNTWWSVAGDIPEMQAIADRLQEEKGINSKKLSERIRAAIPRFEASEEKRKRRDYRLARKAAFARPEPGFSLYEGRTRGKKLKYTYDDEEDIFSDDQPTRRSARNSSGVTAAEPSRPRFTASGRQVRSRAGGAYGESLLSGQREDSEYEEEDDTRPQRSRTSTHPNGYSGYGDEDLDDESEARSNDSGNEWDGGDEEENDFEGDDEGDDASGDESIVNGEPRSLVVQLRYGKGSAHAGPQDPDEPPPAKDALMEDTGQAGVSQRPSGPVDTPQQNLAPGPVAAASMTTPGFPSVPALQVPSQPAASKPTGLPMSALLNAPEPAPQVSTKAYHQPQAPEGPKTGHPVAVNGWNGSHQGAEHRPGSELPRAQAPPTS